MLSALGAIYIPALVEAHCRRERSAPLGYTTESAFAFGNPVAAGVVATVGATVGLTASADVASA
jgi:hypothetical protein